MADVKTHCMFFNGTKQSQGDHKVGLIVIGGNW